MDKKFSSTCYSGRDYVSMQGLKLNHVSKKGPLLDGFFTIICRLNRRWENEMARKILKVIEYAWNNFNDSLIQ